MNANCPVPPEESSNYVLAYVPVNESQAAACKKLNKKVAELAELLFDQCPESLELTTALTNLEAALAWGQASIVKHPSGD